MTIKRRTFMQTGSSALAGLTLVPTVNELGSNCLSLAPSAAVAAQTTQQTFQVVVVGGGLAGVCAAIAAARHGATVALIQDRPVLGGNCSSECRTSPEGNGEFYPWAVATGIIKEIVTEDRLRNHESLSDYQINHLWDLTLYEFVKREEPRLTLFLNTSVRAAEKRENVLTAVDAVQLSTEKSFRFVATLFIDATGQGTLGALARADFHYGREDKTAFRESFAPEAEDQQAMGSTLFFRARDVGREAPFRLPPWAVAYPDETKLRARSHNNPNGGHWWIEIGSPLNTIADNEEIRHQLLRHVLGVWDHLKNHCQLIDRERVRHYALDLITPVTYKREGRRLRGDHVITQNDLQRRELFADRVAFGGWFIDLHEAKGLLDPVPEALAVDPSKIDELGVRPYPVPLGALYSRNVENLLMAGRTISTSHVAFGATRVQQTCAVFGQAAGTAAALCVRRRVRPRVLRQKHIAELQQALLKDDFYIPFTSNADASDLARRAVVTASSDAPFVTPQGAQWWSLENPTCQIFPVSAERIDRVRVEVRNASAAVKNIVARLSHTGDVWTVDETNVLASAEVTVQPSFEGAVDIPLNMKVTPHRLYCLSLTASKDVAWRLADRALEGVSAYTRPRRTWINLRQRKNRWCFAMELVPESRPYGPQNVTNGVARPESWTNLWISDPGGKLPQTLQLAWPQAVEFDTVYLTFDQSLCREHQDLPGFYVYPETMRDYHLEVDTVNGWQRVVEVRDNVHRHRRHKFPAVKSRSLRLTGTRTNGAPSMRVYEVRVYLNEAIG